jgi:hypothetical protein
MTNVEMDRLSPSSPLVVSMDQSLLFVLPASNKRGSIQKKSLYS